MKEWINDLRKLSKERLEVCKTCKNLRTNNTCALCGCYMPLKTLIPMMKCPDKKW